MAGGGFGGSRVRLLLWRIVIRGALIPVPESGQMWAASFRFLCGVLFLIGLAGCAPDSIETGADSAEFGMEHIHGLGVDPADGSVYAGTHYGLFRIGARGKATLVADRVQDFMGFTVVGPGRFLASGHPGEGDDGPSSLGLIESTDSGQSWEGRSMSGEADFHALEYRHDRVYGLNAMTGSLMVSDDMASWQELSDAPMADFAVSPDNPDTLVATTQEGLTVSTDGAQSFELAPGAPVLLFVGWGDDGTLAGVTPDGDVFTTQALDASWTKRGSLGGPPEAFTIESSRELYAATNATVLRSADGGETFSAISEPPE